MGHFQETNYTKRFDIQLWIKLFKVIQRHRWYCIGLAGVMIFVAGIDAVFPMMNKYVVDTFIVPQSKTGIGRFIVLYGLVVLVQSVNVWFLITFGGRIETGACYDIRKRSFEQLQRLSFSYYDTTPAGWIMARLTSDCQKLGEIISWGMVDLVWGMAMMVAIAIGMVVLDWKLALWTLSVVPLLILVSIWFQRKILESQRKVRKTNSRISGAYNEGILGSKTTKTLVREREHLQEFKSLSRSMRLSSIHTAVLTSLYLPIVLTLGSIGTGTALWRGGESIVQGVITYGTLVAFVSYTIQFFHPVLELARVLAELQSAQASAERIFSLIETPPHVQDRREVIQKYGDILSPKKNGMQKPRGQVVFKNVSFWYDSNKKVLNNFNLTIHAGETVALVGETGSGKSTIVNLLCRFYEPVHGQILLDGTDYREYSLSWLHRHTGYVLQTPHLFGGTIRENIRYGNLDAADQQVYAAAKLVCADDFIRKTPKGYDTEVGEGGALLSTGEKQLISFARAVLSDPVFFILDEATSSIDTETEQKIQCALQTLFVGRTSIIIAHRLSTIKNADRVIVLRHGTIVEQGNHAVLMKKRGYYYCLYTNQFVKTQESQLLGEKAVS